MGEGDAKSCLCVRRRWNGLGRAFGDKRRRRNRRRQRAFLLNSVRSGRYVLYNLMSDILKTRTSRAGLLRSEASWPSAAPSTNCVSVVCESRAPPDIYSLSRSRGQSESRTGELYLYLLVFSKACSAARRFIARRATERDSPGCESRSSSSSSSES